jgi:hypothetical protein
VIHNFRNSDYVTKTDFHLRWETKTVHLSYLRGVDFFTNYWGSTLICHAFLSFDFGPDRRRNDYHSIIGDRGRGDTPNNSDDVVPYWSSHLDGAQLERIVPSGHPSHQNKQGMEEVDRILRFYLHNET